MIHMSVKWVLIFTLTVCLTALSLESALAEESCLTNEAQVILAIESIRPTEEGGCLAAISEITMWNMHQLCPLIVEEAVNADFAINLDPKSCSALTPGMAAGLLTKKSHSVGALTLERD